MIYSIRSSSLYHIYFGKKLTKYHTRIFDELIRRATNLINIEPEAISLLNERRYIVEGMLISIFPEFQIVGDDDEGAPIYGEPEDSSPITFAKKLYLNINNIELDSDDHFSWPQYFGLLALMEIDQYIFQFERFLDDASPPPGWPEDENWEQAIADSKVNSLLQVSEAVNLGETLKENIIPVDSLVKDRISKQRQLAAQKRHQPLSLLKNSFISFYTKTKDKSNKSAIARKFYRGLSDHDQKVICQTQEIHKAVRTLTNHLNDFLKRQNWPYIS